ISLSSMYLTSPIPPLLPSTTLFRSKKIQADLANAHETGIAQGGFDLALQRVQVIRGSVRHADGMDAQSIGAAGHGVGQLTHHREDRKSTRLNSSHVKISYAVFCLKK